VPVYQATRFLIPEDNSLHRHLIFGLRIDHKHTCKCCILGSHDDYGPTVFWVLIPCSSSLLFGGTYRLHLQWWKVSQAWNRERQAAVAMKSVVLGVVLPCSSETARRFRGIYSLHLQGRKSKPSKKPAEAGGKLLLRNVGLSSNNTASQTRI
jgi:hypothetical protein